MPLTAVFVHASVLHFAFNAYALYILGRDVEAFNGPVRFSLVFLLAGLSGSVSSLVFNRFPSVGASGAIFGLIGALVESGTSKENAELYVEALRRGGAIVTAKVADDEFGRYSEIMDRTALNVAARESLYRDSGWNGYNPDAPVYDAEQIRRERDAFRL